MRSAAESFPKSPTLSKRQAVLRADGSLQSSFAFPPLTGFSQEIRDRSSIFKAFFFPLTVFSQVSALLTSFRLSTLCEGVDHVMLAYRFSDAEVGVDAGFDDDGERFSGKKLADLLELMDVFGLVIVTRNYGGILLGPIRFQHITQCARESVMAFKHNRSLGTHEIEKLRRLLSARDKTIKTLREIIQNAHLQEVSSDGETGPRASQSSLPGSQTSPLRYEKQDLATLKRLLTARDMTITSLRANLADMTTRANTKTDLDVLTHPGHEAKDETSDAEYE